MGALHGQATRVLYAASSANPDTPLMRQRDDKWLPEIFEIILDKGVAPGRLQQGYK